VSREFELMSCVSSGSQTMARGSRCLPSSQKELAIARIRARRWWLLDRVIGNLRLRQAIGRSATS